MLDTLVAGPARVPNRVNVTGFEDRTGASFGWRVGAYAICADR
jgi:hypothetical protein